MNNKNMHFILKNQKKTSMDLIHNIPHMRSDITQIQNI